LTAGHLARNAPDGARIALAGRSLERLEKVRSGLDSKAADWPLLVVDASDEAQVAELAAATRVVATTVGPYAKYGMPLVAACAAAGTHYCDLTGEVLFVRDAIDAYQDQAAASGARIVNSCGFDSIPSDLGVWVTAQQVAADGEGTLGETLLHVRTLRGGISGGTIDSMRQQAIVSSADPSARRRAGDPYGLSPARDEEPSHRNRRPAPRNVLEKVSRQVPVNLDPVTGRWNAPFFMASYNTRIVRRSNALTNWSYGRDFRYDEVMDTGRGPGGAVKAGLTTAVLGGVFTGMSFGPSRQVLDRVLPKPGEGPSEERMAGGRFVLQIETTTTTGARYRTTVAADEDPGYSGTAIMLGQSALALAFDGDTLPDAAGVLTPATGIGQPLVDRLRAHGFTFDCVRV
jgi:short subunit dehydrogenase-like uncharacterized protein